MDNSFCMNNSRGPTCYPIYNDRQSISSDCGGEHDDESMMDVMNRTHRMVWAAAARKVLVIQPSSAAAEHFFNSKHYMAL